MGLKEEFLDFLTEPKPPSELHRAGATAAGFGTARYICCSPKRTTVVGIAAVLAGHYLARSWALKSIGYGMLASAAVSTAERRLSRREVVADPPVLESSETEVMIGPENVMSNEEFLLLVEDGKLITSTGRDVTATPAYAGPPLESLYIGEGPGVLVPLPGYLARSYEAVSLAAARGRAKRNRRGAPELPSQTEREYLAWARDVCLAQSGPAALALGSGRDPAELQELRTRRDIQLPDGSYRTPSDYVREFGARIDAEYRACAEQVRVAMANGLITTDGRARPTEVVNVIVDQRLPVITPRSDAGQKLAAETVAATAREYVQPVASPQRTIVAELTKAGGQASRARVAGARSKSPRSR
jgi:hypothetical protein